MLLAFHSYSRILDLHPKHGHSAHDSIHNFPSLFKGREAIKVHRNPSVGCYRAPPCFARGRSVRACATHALQHIKALFYEYPDIEASSLSSSRTGVLVLKSKGSMVERC